MGYALIRTGPFMFGSVEAVQNSIAHTKLLLQDIFELGIKKKQISVVINNRTRSDQLLSLSQVEEQLGEKISVVFNPAPELYAQAVRMNTTAVLAQDESITRQQFLNLAEIISNLEAGEG